MGWTASPAASIPVWALPVSGALGAAGMGMLTLDGTAEEWGDFAQDAMANGGMGAVWGAGLTKAAPVIARSGVGQWAEAQATRVLSSQPVQRAASKAQALVQPLAGSAAPKPARVVRLVDEEVVRIRESSVMRERGVAPAAQIVDNGTQPVLVGEGAGLGATVRPQAVTESVAAKGERQT
jgi:hypothetical protein